MRKQDYETLARELRRRIERFKQPCPPGVSYTMDDFHTSLQAASLARYCAEHLAVDRAAFLTACGLKP